MIIFGSIEGRAACRLVLSAAGCGSPPPYKFAAIQGARPGSRLTAPGCLAQGPNSACMNVRQSPDSLPQRGRLQRAAGCKGRLQEGCRERRLRRAVATPLGRRTGGPAALSLPGTPSRSRGPSKLHVGVRRGRDIRLLSPFGAVPLGWWRCCCCCFLVQPRPNGHLLLLRWGMRFARQLVLPSLPRRHWHRQ